MVVKVKRKSINSSGVWEVDETTLVKDTKSTNLTPKPGKVKSLTTPKPGKEKRGKLGISPKPGNQNIESPQKSEILQPESSSVKTNQTFSPLKRQGRRIDESTPAKQTKGSEQRSQMESNQTHRPYTNTNTFCTWTAGELLNLVVNVEENCQHLLEETYSSAVKKVDWSKVSFGERSSKDCEEMWNKLFKKARTNRELVEEIREYLVGKELVTIEKPDDTEEKSNKSKSQDNTASVENSEGNVRSEVVDEDDSDDENEEEENGGGGGDDGEEEEEEGDDDHVGEEEEEESDE